MKILNYLDSFLIQLDTYIAQTKGKMTCQEIFQIQNEITERISRYSKSKANFTGFSEMLIYQSISHFFKKEIKNGEIKIEAGKQYLGKRSLLKKVKGVYVETKEPKSQHPDLTIEKDNKILHLLSIKKQIGNIDSKPEDIHSNTVKEMLLISKDWKEKVYNLNLGDKIPLPVQDINRIENLYEKCGYFKAVTIYYNKPTKDNFEWLNRIKERYPWYDYISLQDNGEKPFIDLLDEKMNLNKICSI
jgi:hypothetical protein